MWNYVIHLDFVLVFPSSIQSLGFCGWSSILHSIISAIIWLLNQNRKVTVLVLGLMHRGAGGLVH